MKTTFKTRKAWYGMYGLFFLAFFILTVYSCKEELVEPDEEPETTVEIAEEKGIISPDFALGSNSALLEYKNKFGQIRQVVPPWGSGARTDASDDVRFDRLKKDGWRVVYNTFVTSQTQEQPVLVIYNVYRGILRWWWFNDTETNAGNFMTFAFQMDGMQTSMLNFAGGRAAGTLREYKNHPYILETNAGEFNTGLANNRWYHFDVETSYDPRISGQAQSSYSLAVNSWATSVSTMTLKGSLTGTANGTITRSGSGVSLFAGLANAINVSKTNTVSTNSVTYKTGEEVKQTLGNKIDSQVSSGLAKALGSAMNKLAGEGLKVIQSPLSNVFASLVSSDKLDKQKVSLSLAAKLDLKGDITTPTPGFVFKGAVPGTRRGNETGFLPLYNHPLGVFNLKSKPVVNYYKIRNDWSRPGYPGTTVQYLLDQSSIQVQLNNEAPLLNGSRIYTSSTLVYLDAYSGDDLKDGVTASPDRNAFLSGMTPVNSVAGNKWYSFSAPYFIRYHWFSRPSKARIAVLVKVTLTPKDSSVEPVEFVKLFPVTFRQGPDR